jgi:hypothetical protein
VRSSGASTVPDVRAQPSVGITISLGKHSKLREVLEDYALFLDKAHTSLSHITELVGPNLLHIYGYTDASCTGMGGAILPATRWMTPTVWCVPYPPEIITLVNGGDISVNDLELAANFVAESIGKQLLLHDVQGLNSWFGSDNTATVSWKTKKTARAKARSHFAPQALRAEALMQRHTRRGPKGSSFPQSPIVEWLNMIGYEPKRGGKEAKSRVRLAVVAMGGSNS